MTLFACSMTLLMTNDHVQMTNDQIFILGHFKPVKQTFLQADNFCTIVLLEVWYLYAVNPYNPAALVGVE
jgi:hypothetical protein